MAFQKIQQGALNLTPEENRQLIESLRDPADDVLVLQEDQRCRPPTRVGEPTARVRAGTPPRARDPKSSVGALPPPPGATT